MAVRLSEHLEYRIKVRKISKSLPAKIVKNAQDLYFDTSTKHWIVFGNYEYAGNVRPMVAVFDQVGDDIDIITVYPTDEKEIITRIKKGRWVHEKKSY